MRILGLGLALALLASAATAQTFDSRTAKKQLFSAKGGDVQFADSGIVNEAVAKAIKAAAGQIPYYGAIAVSPGEPTSSNLMATVANFHSVKAASAAALRDCNARRTVGKPCIVIAAITPKRYKSRNLTLSKQATAAFGKEYRRLKAPKGMAISESTGVFGLDRGDGGRAVSRCNAAAKALGAQDCRLVIIDN